MMCYGLGLFRGLQTLVIIRGVGRGGGRGGGGGQTTPPFLGQIVRAEISAKITLLKINI